MNTHPMRLDFPSRLRAPRRLLAVILGLAALVAVADDGDGFLPADARLLPLTVLPSAPEGAPARLVVRLAASGRPLVLYRGRLVTLAERPAEAMADWSPPVDAEALRDFCWLDDRTLVLLRETALDFIRDGRLVRGVKLPGRGLQLARADATHCYLFGGARAPRNRDLLLFGLDGSVRNLFRASQAVTAVAGDGRHTFAATGSVVYFLAPGAAPRPVFRERKPIVGLAYAPPVGVFYLTGDGVGCMDAPGSGLIFLRREITSLDCRNGRLILLTGDREVILIAPVGGFPRAIQSVRRFADEARPPEPNSFERENEAEDGGEPPS
jgi:hypothetical protein